ncbi:hypothetical protein RND81_05G226600 [Saponaria officinalis]|uniref:GTP cyclohydrolase 1 n=1 Tax=Saponaria officinalis TaxID=3572 RepID=A0AAW1L325_SAPOF
MSMGALNDCHYDVELENAIKMGCIKLGVEEEPQTAEIENAVKVLLHGLGEDVNREGIKKTPLRVAKALLHGTRGYRQNVNEIIQGALFPEAGLDNNRVGHAGGAGGLVIVRDLDLFSYCESCLLPFQMKCHVGYVPSGQRVVGLSKLSRVADVFAKRLQNPQRLADEVCSALHRSIKPAGVAVILQCFHIHFPTLESLLLDTRPCGLIKILVSSGSGVFQNHDADIWSEFLSLSKLKSVTNKTHEQNPANIWCPSIGSPVKKILSNVTHVDPMMVSAVSSIIRSLGEDPSRKELVGTSARFVRWLMNFQHRNMELKLNGFVSKKLETPKMNGEVKSEQQICSELSLPFWSQCEHHLLPFHGVVHIGYFSAEEESRIEKSLLQSIVHFYGFKLQVQERLTRQIAETIAPLLGGDIMVVAEASHTCMISRGIEKFGSSTATVAVLGRFATDAGARASFLDSLPRSNDFYR